MTQVRAARPIPPRPTRIRSLGALLALAALAACNPAPPDESGGKGAKGDAAPAADRPTIGFLLGTLKEERWGRDRDFFVAEAERLGAEVLVQSANNDDATQAAQAENMLTRGVDVLVVVPNNAKAAASIVAAAHRERVPVISYDRLITDADVDLYLSVDPVRVGELQAEYLVRRAPRGNYILLAGAPTDNNAHLLRRGQQSILKPYIDRGDIRVVSDQFVEGWQPIEALKHTENALTRAGNQVAAVLAPNDGTAGGAIQALAEQGLAGRVPVTGQDAELAAAQRIVAGTQSMTIYKPIRRLATEAAAAAVRMARGEGPPATTRTVNNGKKEVPSILIEPVAVDRANLRATVIAEGYLREADVFRGAPATTAAPAAPRP